MTIEGDAGSKPFENLNQKLLLEALKKALDETNPTFFREDVPFVAKRTAGRIAFPIKLLWKGVSHLKENGFDKSSRLSFEKIKIATTDAKVIPGRLKKAARFAADQVRSDLVKNPDNVALYIASLCSLTVGLYIGNESPDTDWHLNKLGLNEWVGGHRNIFFHSALTSAVLLLMGRYLMRLSANAAQNLPPSSAESNFCKFLSVQLSLMTTGAVVGVGIHTVFDGTLDGDKSVENPFAGTFVYGTIIDDNAWLVFNGVLSILHGKDVHLGPVPRKTA